MRSETMGNIQLDVFTPATEMLRALRSKQVSSIELLQMHLDQIERYNPQINVIVTPDFDNARKVAAAADRTLVNDGGGALLGLPITIKDCIDVKGLLSTGGVEEWADHVSEADSLVAA
ncbi:MAG: amidase family protein, partial [Dehalococcoidia bacterium]